MHLLLLVVVLVVSTHTPTVLVVEAARVVCER
jgi:hypothetical protein